MTKRIVVTDIWGVTPQLEKVANGLQGDVIVLSPYGSQHRFDTDEQAYQHFNHVTNLDEYTVKLSLQLSQLNGDISLIGFSMGAAAIWQLSQAVNPKVKSALGFYGGQIRHELSINPQCPMELIWPQSEAHFDMGEVINALNGRQNVTQQQTSYAHGFMNQLSTGFNQQGFDLFCEKLSAIPAEQPISIL